MQNMIRRSVKKNAALIIMAYAIFLAPVHAQSMDEMLRMTEQLDALDRSDLESYLGKVRTCTQLRNFTCASEELAKASKVTNSPADKKLLEIAKNEIAREQQEVAREEQERKETLRLALAAQEAERQARYEAVYAMAAREESSSVDYGAAILGGIASAMAGKAQIDAIHNQGIANLQRTYTERARQERAVQEQRTEQQAEARQQRQEAQRASDPANATQRAGQASRWQTTARQDRSEVSAREAARQAQQQADDQELLALEQRQKTRSTTAFGTGANATIASAAPSIDQTRPVYRYLWKQEYQTRLSANSEAEAKSDAEESRAMGERAMAKSAGKPGGFISWRVANIGPFNCVNRKPKGTTGRGAWDCTFVATYEVENTQPKHAGID